VHSEGGRRIVIDGERNVPFNGTPHRVDLGWAFRFQQDIAVHVTPEVDVGCKERNFDIARVPDPVN